MLDCARARAIGFSHCVSLGEHADVDFGDMLDYLASEPKARAILLHIKSIESPPEFMSAARAAALLRRLDAVLPVNWSRGNPIDIIGDAPVERYVQALKVLNDNPAAGAVLVHSRPLRDRIQHRHHARAGAAGAPARAAPDGMLAWRGGSGRSAPDLPGRGHRRVPDTRGSRARVCDAGDLPPQPNSTDGDAHGRDAHRDAHRDANHARARARSGPTPVSAASPCRPGCGAAMLRS